VIARVTLFSCRFNERTGRRNFLFQHWDICFALASDVFALIQLKG
jgi:hypothetical protein